MKIAIMQPYLFPYIGYWQLINACDKFLILDDVNYIKRGWINRNRILCDGKVQYITDPVSGATQNALICDLSFVNDAKQLANIEKTVEYAYRDASYIGTAKEILHTVLSYPDSNIAAALEFQIRLICEKLGMDTEIYRTSALRSPDHPAAEDGIIELCRQFSASLYINPIGGTSLYHSEKFAEYGMELRFLQTDFNAVERVAGCGQNDLSIIDLFAKYPVDKIREMLECYQLIEGE